MARQWSSDTCWYHYVFIHCFVISVSQNQTIAEMKQCLKKCRLLAWRLFITHADCSWSTSAIITCKIAIKWQRNLQSVSIKFTEVYTTKSPEVLTVVSWIGRWICLERLCVLIKILIFGASGNTIYRFLLLYDVLPFQYLVPPLFMVTLNLLCRIRCCCLQPFIIHSNVLILTIIHHTDNGQKPQRPITSSSKNSSLLNRFTFCSHISACECTSSSAMLCEFALDDAALKGQRRAELGI